jgi:chromosome partitioning protein
MKVISVLSQKGGSGKTTITLHLAVAALLRKKQVAIIDLDPQASAAQWADSREAEEPAVVSAQAARLEKVLSAAEEAGANLCLIDTAPHSESSALGAARAADLVVIPCRPAILDLRAISSTVELVNMAKVKGVVVLNAAPPRGTLASEAQKVIEGMGIEVVPHQVTQRAVFTHSLTDGKTALEYEPKGKGAQEIKLVYKYICRIAEL